MAQAKTKDEVSFKISDADTMLVTRILARATVAFPKTIKTTDDAFHLRLDLTAAHANGCPLDFNKLLGSPDFDFIGDVLGIRSALCRETGTLKNDYRPRCAL